MTDFILLRTRTALIYALYRPIQYPMRTYQALILQRIYLLFLYDISYIFLLSLCITAVIV